MQNQSPRTVTRGIKQARRSERLRKIVSGGQTGVDRGALDAAIAFGAEHGGWCPQGRLAEDGPIPPMYRLRQTRSKDYAVRTERNVRNSHGTLILHRGTLAGGTLLTHRLVLRHGKPLLSVDLSEPYAVSEIAAWIAEHRIRILNVAGPRESSCDGIADQAQRLVSELLAICDAR